MRQLLLVMFCSLLCVSVCFASRAVGGGGRAADDGSAVDRLWSEHHVAQRGYGESVLRTMAAVLAVPAHRRGEQVVREVQEDLLRLRPEVLATVASPPRIAEAFAEHPAVSVDAEIKLIVAIWSRLMTDHPEPPDRAPARNVWVPGLLVSGLPPDSVEDLRVRSDYKRALAENAELVHQARAYHRWERAAAQYEWAAVMHLRHRFHTSDEAMQDVIMDALRKAAGIDADEVMARITE